MPEFDTYKAIERYAKNNDNPEAFLGYQFLKRRTQATIMWRTLMTGIDSSAAIKLYLGIKESVGASRDLADMSEEERKAMYDAACREAGIQLDPSTFKNK